eukprot:CAMPEP_0197837026 /NCGR_PEP_ID=MMETSP1437-20131217/30866_1 /TAXON_ID=49252 ORGANISM="Eucampia antarctica, Strain CCMP1452" /NCGR_SAMPLE_ID=MMETSP1437 /ASSEMBLY_ACC=CAM_ASM_001096 /LENGTH=253 /DNA_ID=CAMNT_0043443705 /DNA_START=35 /DNA_END=796 /DNA_ORIENTATION=+
MTILVLCSWMLIFCTIARCAAFTVPSQQHRFGVTNNLSPCRGDIASRSLLLFSSLDEDSEVTRKRRRKRKDGKSAGEAAQSNSIGDSNNEVAAPREAPAVEMQVMDVRDILSGTSSFSDSVPTNSALDNTSSSLVESGVSLTKPSGFNNDDSMERLLADARKMRSEAPEEEMSAPNAIKNVISTIVTFDFFVVCGLLLWFLSGIFCSYIIKDDTVQIAFNNIFEPIVQPALGVLMIGSAAGGIFEDGNDDENR